jgi:hypothetical protein
MNVPYATAYQALFNRAHGQAGETLLVHGASGGVGIAAVQLARARGLTVIGTAGTERGRKLVLSEGAHHVLDHMAPNYLDECVRLTGGQGPAIIMEMLALVVCVVAASGANAASARHNARHDRARSVLGRRLFHGTAGKDRRWEGLRLGSRLRHDQNGEGRSGQARRIGPEMDLRGCDGSGSHVPEPVDYVLIANTFHVT